MEFLQQSIESLVEPTDDFTSCTTDETLGGALSQLTSSHDALLVYDAEHPDQLAGILTNQQYNAHTAHPQSARLDKALINPPQLSSSSTIIDALSAMDSLRVNLLPLKDQQDYVGGVITVKSILDALQKDDQALGLIINQLHTRRPITAPYSSNIGQITEIMDSHAITRVILTSDSGAVAGIVSRRDLADAYIQPSNRQRFSTKDGSPISRTFDPEKSTRSQEPVSSFATTKVNTANDTSPIAQAIKPILTGQSSSVVLIDASNQPTGFISRRDIINALLNLQTQPEFPITFRHPDINLTPTEKERLHEIAQAWAAKLSRRLPFSQITISYEVNKSNSGRVTAVETVVMVDPAAGPSSDSLISKNTTRSWVDGLRQGIDTIESQLRRRKS